MFARDIYKNDYTMRYYPKYFIEHFERDMFHPSKRLLHSVIFTPDEQKALINQSVKASYLTIGSLVSSILCLFLYDKIPLIKKVQRRGRRIILKCLIVIIPYVSVSLYSSYINTKFLIENFEKFKIDYKKYKENGDVKELNPKIESILYNLYNEVLNGFIYIVSDY